MKNIIELQRAKKLDKKDRLDEVERKAKRTELWVYSITAMLSLIMVAIFLILSWLSNLNSLEISNQNNSEVLPLFQENSNFCIYGKIKGMGTNEDISIRINNELAYIKDDEYFIISNADSKAVNIVVYRNNVLFTNFSVSLQQKNLRQEDIILN